MKSVKDKATAAGLPMIFHIIISNKQSFITEKRVAHLTIIKHAIRGENVFLSCKHLILLKNTSFFISNIFINDLGTFTRLIFSLIFQ